MTRLEWPSFENLRRCVDPELGPVLEGSPTPAVPAPARVAASCACAQGPALRGTDSGWNSAWGVLVPLGRVWRLGVPRDLVPASARVPKASVRK